MVFKYYENNEALESAQEETDLIIEKFLLHAHFYRFK